MPTFERGAAPCLLKVLVHHALSAAHDEQSCPVSSSRKHMGQTCFPQRWQVPPSRSVVQRSQCSMAHHWTCGKPVTKSPHGWAMGSRSCCGVPMWRGQMTPKGRVSPNLVPADGASSYCGVHRISQLARVASRRAQAACIVTLQSVWAQSTLSHERPKRPGTQKQHASWAFSGSAENTWPQNGWTHSPTSFGVGVATNIAASMCKDGGHRKHEWNLTSLSTHIGHSHPSAVAKPISPRQLMCTSLPHLRHFECLSSDWQLRMQMVQIVGGGVQRPCVMVAPGWTGGSKPNSRSRRRIVAGDPRSCPRATSSKNMRASRTCGLRVKAAHA